MKLNQAAFEQAQSLIRAAKVVRESSWREEQPSSHDENEFLVANNWETYGKWYLGLDTGQDPETREHYGFLYGDFVSVHRSGLIAAKQRAAQHDYKDIEEAINQLIVQIDKEPDVVTEASEGSFPASDPPNYRSRR